MGNLLEHEYIKRQEVINSIYSCYEMNLKIITSNVKNTSIDYCLSKILQQRKEISIRFYKYYGYGIDDNILCEFCSNKATDIHHIFNKAIGGSKSKDYIENLIALCRKCHTDAHNEKITKEQLISIHKLNIKQQ